MPNRPVSLYKLYGLLEEGIEIVEGEKDNYA